MSQTETLFETVTRVLDYPKPPQEPGVFYRPARFDNPQPPVAPINRWMDVYTRELTAAHQANPEAFFWPIEHIGRITGKMREAFISGSFNKDSHTIKATCKHFGIKHTYASIKAFLAGEQ